MLASQSQVKNGASRLAQSRDLGSQLNEIPKTKLIAYIKLKNYILSTKSS